MLPPSSKGRKGVKKFGGKGNPFISHFRFFSLSSDPPLPTPVNGSSEIPRFIVLLYDDATLYNRSCTERISVCGLIPHLFSSRFSSSSLGMKLFHFFDGGSLSLIHQKASFPPPPPLSLDGEWEEEREPAGRARSRLSQENPFPYSPAKNTPGCKKIPLQISPGLLGSPPHHHHPAAGVDKTISPLFPSLSRQHHQGVSRTFSPPLLLLLRKKPESVSLSLSLSAQSVLL